MKSYMGAICDKHPELGGARRPANRTCIGCAREILRAYHVKKRLKDKETVFAHYGTECKACGIDDMEVLTIDHEDQDGANHMRDNEIKSRRFYAWLIENGLPPGFRTLCFNCNIKAFRAHQRNRG